MTIANIQTAEARHKAVLLLFPFSFIESIPSLCFYHAFLFSLSNVFADFSILIPDLF